MPYYVRPLICSVYVVVNCVHTTPPVVFFGVGVQCAPDQNDTHSFCLTRLDQAKSNVVYQTVKTEPGVAPQGSDELYHRRYKNPVYQTCQIYIDFTTNEIAFYSKFSVGEYAFKLICGKQIVTHFFDVHFAFPFQTFTLSKRLDPFTIFYCAICGILFLCLRRDSKVQYSPNEKIEFE